MGVYERGGWWRVLRRDFGEGDGGSFSGGIVIGGCLNCVEAWLVMYVSRGILLYLAPFLLELNTGE